MVRLASTLRRRAFAALVALICATAIPVLAGLETAVAAPKPARGCVPEQPDEAAARRMLAVCGKRVEILAERTEYAQIFLNPTGSRTLEQSIEPTRVRQGRSWVPVDTSLRRTPEGVVPRATVLPMAFSGGGDGLIGTLRDGDRELSIIWPGTLPRPRLAGDTATYPQVLPGVDLRVTATATGFSEVLVVRDRQAAANPRLAAIRFGTRTKGVRLSSTAEGGLVARDSSGAPVFKAPSPLMWDSTPSPDATAAEPRKSPPPGGTPGSTGGSVREAVMPVKVEDGAVTVTPDRGMLTDPRTRFPVHIDPSVTGGLVKNEWTSVWSKHPTSSFWKNTSALTDGKTFGSAGAGRTEDCPGCADHIIRSLFRMDTSKVKNTRIEAAEFHIEQRHAWTCKPASNAKLWLTGNFSSATTWRKQPSWYSKTTAQTMGNRKYGAVHGCIGTGNIEFNAKAMVERAAKGGWNSISVGLRAINEGTLNQWKRFNPSTAKLVITYNRPPNAATQRLSDGKACVVGNNRPYVLWANPTLSARQSDPDTGQQSLTTDFYWWAKGGTRSESNKVSQSNGNNAIVSKQIPQGRLTDGGTYVWQAKTSDGSLSTWSGTCEFTVDATPPPAPAGLASDDYSAAEPRGGVGQPGTFTIAPPSVRRHEVVAYAWTLDSGTMIASQIVPADKTTQSGSVQVIPAHDGMNTLRVWSKDHAGRFSDSPVTYSFQVRAGAGPAAEWTFDEDQGDAVDISGHGNTATLGTSVTRVPGRGQAGSALNLTGAASSSVTAPAVTYPHPDTGVQTPVRTDQSFTVAARVRLGPIGGVTNQRIAVAASGSRVSAYTLGYSANDNRWRFTMAGADIDNPPLFSVLSNAAPVPGKWTHIAGVYEASTRKLTLYVNGVAQSATAILTGGFHATGPVTIGKRTWNGSDDGYLTAAVDDVRIYGYPESPSKIALLGLPLQPVLSLPSGEEAKYGGTLPVTFDARGDTNVTKFRYSVGDTTLGTTVNAPAPGGSVTVDIPAGLVSGQRPVHAVAVDDGNQTSPLTQTLITVGPPNSLNGTVLDSFTWLPVGGATVTLEPGGRQTVSDADGAYAFGDLAVGTYTVVASSGGRCGMAGNQAYEVDGQGLTLDLFLRRASDGLGHTCIERSTTFAAAGTVLPLTGDDTVGTVDLPFAFPFYGSSYRSVWVDTNGLLSFTDPLGSRPYRGTGELIDVAEPNGVIAPFWDDLVVDGSAGVRTSVTGSGAAQRFLIEWRNVYRKANSAHRLSFEVTLAPDGTVVVNYSGLDNAAEQGSSALVGIESPEGDDGFAYSAREASLASGRAIVFTRSDVTGPFETYNLSGTLTDAAGAPAAGVPVTLDPGGLTVTTGPDGVYSFFGVEADSYTMVARRPGQKCGTAVEEVVDLEQDTVRNLRLGTDYGIIGYACATSQATWTSASTVVPLRGNGVRAQVTFPFPVRFYGALHTSASVSEDGYAQMGAGFLVPFFTDFTADASSSLRTQSLGGSAPNRSFVIEWRNMLFTGTTERVTFEVVLHEDGRFVYQYATGGTTNRQKGSTATVSLQTPHGLIRYYSGNEPILTPGSSVAWTPAAPGAVRGVLTEASTTEPVGGATVTLDPGNRTTTTADDGSYEFTGVPVGQYTLQVSGGHNRCWGEYAFAAVVKTLLDESVDLSAPAAQDIFYDCATASHPYAPAADVRAGWTGDDQVWRTATPFPIKLYGESHKAAWVTDDGTVALAPPDGPTSPGQWAYGAVQPFRDDWVVDAQAAIATGVTGTAPNRRWTVEWRNVHLAGDTATRVTFQATFDENGGVTFNYDGIDAAVERERGSHAWVGITGYPAHREDDDDYGYTYARGSRILADDLSVRLTPGAGQAGFSGTVTCAGVPVEGARISAGGVSATSLGDGTYQVDGLSPETVTVVATLPAGPCSGSRLWTGMLGRHPAVIDFPAEPTEPGKGYRITEIEIPYVPLPDTAAVPMDTGFVTVPLPFPVTLQGHTVTEIHVEDLGALGFDTGDDSSLWLEPMWGGFVVDAEADVRVANRGTAPNREFVAEWHNVAAWNDPDTRTTFQAIAHENGSFDLVYPSNDGTYLVASGDAMVGIEDGTENQLLYARRTPTLRQGLGLRFDPPAGVDAP